MVDANNPVCQMIATARSNAVALAQASGGAAPLTAASAGIATTPPTSRKRLKDNNLESRLNLIKDMADDGIISKDEAKRKRDKILDSLGF